MTMFSRVQIAGSLYNELNAGTVNIAAGDAMITSNCNLSYKNYIGKYRNSWNVGDEIIITIGSHFPTSSSDGKKIFTGIVEDITFNAEDQSSNVSLLGKDYGGVLQDITIPPEVYTNQEISVIIIDLFAKYAPEISTSAVSITTVILPRISFNHDTLYSAMTRFADYSGYFFYVDVDKVLHFSPKQTTDSGYSFGHNNATTNKTNWKSTRKELYNNVWVYGDRTLNAWKEVFNVAAGSVYTLLYNPHNTAVEVNGVLKKGGVLEMTVIPDSGTNYLVSYNDKTITFVSGATIGDSIPTIGSILISYQRELPIVKFGRDRTSEDYYGKREKVILDRSIKDPNEATDILFSTLNNYSNPKVEGTINVNGYYDITMGQYCTCNFPKEGIGSKAYDIIGVTYNINPNTLFSGEFMTLKLNKKIKNITDEIVSMKEDIKKLQASEVVSTEILTRYEFDIGSVGIAANWKVYSSNIGSAFVLDNGSNCILGSEGVGLGSDNATPFSVILSGGTW